MITLLIEIALTCKAWKRGWKGWALLPMAICIGGCFTLGMAIGVSGGSTEAALVIGLLADIGTIVVLGVMVAAGRQTLPAGNEDVMEGADMAANGTTAERTAA
jgi:hypothetical protein